MLVAVLLGSVRTERMGNRAARWVMAELKKRGHETVLVDPDDLKLPMLDKMWKELKGSEAPEDAALKAKLKTLADLYARVDGFCVVSAEYNHSAPPALVNLIDYFLEEYFFRPSAIVCYSAVWRSEGGDAAACSACGGRDAYDSFASTDSLGWNGAQRGRRGADAGTGGEVGQVL